VAVIFAPRQDISNDATAQRAPLQHYL
jgi:hypothetical protein